MKRVELPKGWYAIASDELWLGDRTYTHVDYGQLPRLDRTFDESFDWLCENGPRDNLIVEDSHVSKERLEALVQRASEQGITLPSSFIKFFSTPALQARIPSPTACWLDLPQRLIEYGDGFLLRFLADQQICVVWYLFLRGSEHVAVYANDYAGGPTDSDDGARARRADALAVRALFGALDRHVDHDVVLARLGPTATRGLAQ